MQMLSRTPLYDRHVAAGARMVPFAGWEMPVQYEGVIQEHRAVRTDAGVFDVSHMGELEIEGPRAAQLLQSLLSNDLGRIEPGEAQYTLLTNEHGGIVDDLIAYKLTPHRYLLIVNASNREADYAWLKQREIAGTEVSDRSDEYALLAVQGPRAIERLSLPAAAPFTFAMGEVDGIEVMVNRTGYTGEDGCELLCMTDDASARGLLPAARQRHHDGDRRDLGRARLGLRARQRLHGCRGAATDQGARSGAEARGVRHDRQGGPAPGHADRGRRRGDLGHALAHARCRHRARLRAGRVSVSGHRDHDRRARQAAAGEDRQEADLQTRGALTWRPARATPRD